jgi:hypothetical protein
MTKELKNYDAKADADLLAQPLKKWANIGFLRGFAGVRNEIIPGGEVTLPSSVFHRVAIDQIGYGNPSKEEMAKRLKYVEDVVAMLSQSQAHYVEEHYKRSIYGHIADFITALIMTGLIIGLFQTYGYFHPLALSLVGLLGAKLLFLFVSVRRMIKIARNTFAKQTMNISLPWIVTN